MKILYIKTEDPVISPYYYNNFLHDTLLIGLRNNFGNDVVDYPGAWYMYPKEREKKVGNSTEKFWGKLFTLYDSLEKYNSIDREDIKNKIKKNFFDFVVYGAIRGKNIFLEEAFNSKSKIIFIDTSDDGILDRKKVNKGAYFKMEFTDLEKNVYPIHLAVPKKKIVKSINTSPKNILSPLIPGMMKTYIYEKENEYYPFRADYKMVHIVYLNREIQSNFWNELNPLFSALDLLAVLRVKINLSKREEKVTEHGMHVDYSFPHKTGILSINTCDGYTKLEDGTKIDSVANRMLLFDASNPHNSSTTTGRWRITKGQGVR